MRDRYWMRVCWGPYDSVTRWYNDTPEDFERAWVDYYRAYHYWETSGIAFYDIQEETFLRKWGNA